MSTDPKLIEAVARALCVSEGGDPDFDYNPLGLGGWEPGTDLRWKCYRKSAQAAIAAYEAARGDGVWVPSEPTDAMLRALQQEATVSGYGRRGGPLCYRAIIAAAKGE